VFDFSYKKDKAQEVETVDPMLFKMHVQSSQVSVFRAMDSWFLDMGLYLFRLAMA
jgi:hypothetical protein